jgi:hypothetical protein
VVKLPVPCSFDFNIAATKYFHGIEDGEAPLIFLFSGSVFYRDENDNLQIGQIAWSKESAYRLPVRVWRSMMDHYYPQTAWLCLRRDAFDELYRYKRAKGLPSFEQALDDLLVAKSTSVPSKLDRIKDIANAVLYEGYILDPIDPRSKIASADFGGVFRKTLLVVRRACTMVTQLSCAAAKWRRSASRASCRWRRAKFRLSAADSRLARRRKLPLRRLSACTSTARIF